MEKIIKLYCEHCDKETEHKKKFSLIKNFVDGAKMVFTRGWSLNNQTELYKCCNCGNIVEIEVEN